MCTSGRADKLCCFALLYSSPNTVVESWPKVFEVRISDSVYSVSVDCFKPHSRRVPVLGADLPKRRHLPKQQTW